MRKKLCLILGCLVALAAMGATTMRVSEYPNRPIPQDPDLFLLASVVNSTNYNSSWAQIKAALGVGTGTIGSSNVWATNVIVTRNLYASNANFTNLTVQEGITNASLTPNTVLKADANKRISSIPNAYGVLTNDSAGAVGYDPTIVGTNIINDMISNTVFGNNLWSNSEITTALGTYTVLHPTTTSNIWFKPDGTALAWNGFPFVLPTYAPVEGNFLFAKTATQLEWTNNIQNLVVSNAVFTTNTTVYLFSATNHLGDLMLTNGMVIQEHAWDGPTNLVKCGITNRYYFTANTPCAITQLVAYASPNWENHSVLEITNASTTNITITVHAPIRIPVEDSTRVYTLTNGNVMACSLEVATMGSNSVLRAFKP